MADIVELIMQDHRTVESLFERFRRGAEGAVASAICQALNAHAEAEEHVAYPAFAQIVGTPVAQLLAEQSHAKSLVKRALQSEGFGLVEIMATLEAAIRVHVDEEEADFLPQLREALSADQLDVLGVRYLAVKQRLG